MHPAPTLSAWEGEASPAKFSKGGGGGGGLTGTQLLDGGCWEGGGDFFHGGCNFLTKKNKIWNVT